MRHPGRFYLDPAAVGEASKSLLNFSNEQLLLCPSVFHRVHGDAHDMPLPDACVDATMICWALGHLDIDEALQECARVTRPGGGLFIYDLTSEDDRRLEAFDYECYSPGRIVRVASGAGYALDQMLLPQHTHVDHFFDKMDKATFTQEFAGARPALFRFSKRREDAVVPPL